MNLTECRCPECEAELEREIDDVSDEEFCRSVQWFFEGVPDENLR
jgi:hypothetical protein